MNPSPNSLEQQLIALVAGTPWLMAALRAARGLGLASWCIGAGAIRDRVWDALGGAAQAPRHADVDLVYFDAQDLTPESERALVQRLSGVLPDLRWDVVNQAAVHSWLCDAQGRRVAALRSLDEALASWPETATAVGVWLDADEQLRVIAPLGLEDVFAGLVRHNPARTSATQFRQRLASKDWLRRWPFLRVVQASEEC